jgi:hypothetical protein
LLFEWLELNLLAISICDFAECVFCLKTHTQQHHKSQDKHGQRHLAPLETQTTSARHGIKQSTNKEFSVE